MREIYRDARTIVFHGDAAALTLSDNSVDAIVCDPPYELGFMGKNWDGSGVAYDSDMWRGCLRVLKPGGHLVAFGGTRTWHRLCCAIEDAGFEIRDSIAWMYGSGFPKSHDVSKAIDKAAGASRNVVGSKLGLPGYSLAPSNGDHRTYSRGLGNTSDPEAECAVTAPATDDARHWAGWGTALKPAFEPIIVARKRLSGTVAANVLAHGTGGLNIDGCRVASDEDTRRNAAGGDNGLTGSGTFRIRERRAVDQPERSGRWPTNVVLSHVPTLDEHGEPDGDACVDGCVAGCPVAELDGQSGISTTSKPGQVKRSKAHQTDAMAGTLNTLDRPEVAYGDTGGASRFFPTFRYQPKAPTKERVKVDGIAHPTVKPLALMRWLVRLVTPPGGVVLDMFAGSGTTIEAARIEGFQSIGVECEASYLPLIGARIGRSGTVDHATGT